MKKRKCFAATDRVCLMQFESKSKTGVDRHRGLIVRNECLTLEIARCDFTVNEMLIDGRSRVIA